MATFSENQVRQLYVANKKATVNSTAAEGTIEVKSDNAKSHVYFKYMGAGGQMRSDLIDINNIISVKATKSASMERALKTATISLNASVNSGNPVGGNDYLVRISIRQFLGMSDENIYLKYGTVHTYLDMTAKEFYVKMGISLFENFSRESSKLFKFYLKTAESKEELTQAKIKTLKNTQVSSLSDYTGVIIEEIPLDWVLGTRELVPVYFTVSTDLIVVDGDEVNWGKVEYGKSDTVIKNGKKIADLEYFCMGERGDQYRNVGWPDVIPTKYLVDPSKEYHVLDIHYFYAGSNEGPQKSEKTITIVAPGSAFTLINGIIGDWNTATGRTDAELS